MRLSTVGKKGQRSEGEAMELTSQSPPSQLEMGPQDKVNVTLQLLTINREEIRHWQNYAFQASFWLNAGMVGLTTFIYEKTNDSRPAFVVASGGLVLLSLVYIVFMHYCRKAILANGNDLLKLQYVLKLHTKGEYLPNDSIYGGPGKWLPQRHLIGLVVINLAIMVLCIIFLSNPKKIEPPTVGPKLPTQSGAKQ